MLPDVGRYFLFGASRAKWGKILKKTVDKGWGGGLLSAAYRSFLKVFPIRRLNDRDLPHVKKRRGSLAQAQRAGVQK